jgi:hypothetical protein
LEVHVGQISGPTTRESLHSAPQSVFSLATVLCIKDTNVLSISHDVVFDKQIFPFKDLHENVGAKLKQEISLLSPNLVPSYNMFQAEQNLVQREENTAR